MNDHDPLMDIARETLMERASRRPASGEYPGVWSGNTVTFQAGKRHFEGRVKKGMRGMIPVTVVIDDDGMRVRK